MPELSRGVLRNVAGQHVFVQNFFSVRNKDLASPERVTCSCWVLQTFCVKKKKSEKVETFHFSLFKQNAWIFRFEMVFCFEMSFHFIYVF